MNTSLSFSLFYREINNLIDRFEEQPEKAILNQIEQFIQKRKWTSSQEAQQLDQLKKRLILAHIDPNNALIKQIKVISSFLKAGPLAKLPKNILVDILEKTDPNTIRSLACTHSLFQKLLKDQVQF